MQHGSECLNALFALAKMCLRWGAISGVWCLVEGCFYRRQRVGGIPFLSAEVRKEAGVRKGARGKLRLWDSFS